MRSLRESKRGVFFFVIDVIIAILILFITIIIITSFYTSKPALDATENTITRASETLFNIRIADIDNPKTIEMRSDGKVPDFDMSIDEVVTYYWYHNDTNMSRQLIANSTSWLSSQTGFLYLINDTEIYRREAAITTENESDVKLSRKKITLVQGSGNTSYKPVLTEVRAWQ
ncbi:MAG: hypothetical protein ACLFTH_03215 [Candidatus Woesearchaeota archaeon]